MFLFLFSASFGYVVVIPLLSYPESKLCPLRLDVMLVRVKTLELSSLGGKVEIS